MRRIAMIFLEVLIAVGLAIPILVERIEDEYVVVIGDKYIDPLGEFLEMKNKVLRDCTQVANIAHTDDEWKQLTKELEIIGEGGASPRKILKLHNWRLVESEFANNEPAIFIFEKVSNNYQKLATYGGTAAPFKDAPVIRSYLIDQIPHVPIALIQCYDPVGAPFNFH